MEFKHQETIESTGCINLPYTKQGRATHICERVHFYTLLSCSYFFKKDGGNYIYINLNNQYYIRIGRDYEEIYPIDLFSNESVDSQDSLSLQDLFNAQFLITVADLKNDYLYYFNPYVIEYFFQKNCNCLMPEEYEEDVSKFVDFCTLFIKSKKHCTKC